MAVKEKDKVQTKAKVDVVKKDACVHKYKIEFPSELVKEELESSFRWVSERASMPGFRKGKVPMELVKKNFVDDAKEHAVRNLVGTGVDQVVKDNELRPVIDPKVTELKFESDQPLKFEVELEIFPVFEPKEYKKLNLTKTVNTITDTDVNNVIEKLRERRAYLVDSLKLVAENTHFVVVDYEEEIDGRPEQKVNQKDLLLDLNRDFVIPDVNKNIIGMKPGESKEINSVIPKDFENKNLVGSKFKVKVTLKQLKEKRLPELNDEFAKAINAETVDVLKQRVKETLEKDEFERQRNDVLDQIGKHLIKHNNVSVPPSLVEDRLESFIDNLHQIYKNQRRNEEEWVKNLPQMRERYRPETERNIRLGLVMSMIAKNEKLDPEDDKVYQFILENSNVKEVPGKGIGKEIEEKKGNE